MNILQFNTSLTVMTIAFNNATILNYLKMQKAI